MKRLKRKHKASANLSAVLAAIVVILIIVGAVIFAVKTEQDRTSRVLGNRISEAEWPSDLPLRIPIYPAGKIQAVSSEKEDGHWVITIRNTDAEHFSQYKEVLSGEGWTVATSVDQEETKIMQLKKDSYQITVAYHLPTKGTLITMTKPSSP